jgi:3-methyladenine DNA glycosylase Mpg
MNVVTQEIGTASAVLLRSARILELGDHDDAGDVPRGVIRGPGNLTRALEITGADNGVDCCEVGGRIEFWGPSDGEKHFGVGCSARVGITRERERPWRYFLVET